MYLDSSSENYNPLLKKIVYYSIFTIGMILFFIPFVIKSILNKRSSKKQKVVIKSWMEDNVKEYRQQN